MMQSQKVCMQSDLMRLLSERNKLTIKLMEVERRQVLQSEAYIQTSVREYVFYVVFIQKTRLFTFLFEMTYQEVAQKVSSLFNVYRNFGLKTSECYG